MVFAINSVDSSEKSYTAFQKSAEAQASTAGNNTGDNSQSGAASTGNGAVSFRGMTVGLAVVVPALVALLL